MTGTFIKPQTPSPPVGAAAVGLIVGWTAGVGPAVGLAVGAAVGLIVGRGVGLAVGAAVGLIVGRGVGLAVGLAVGSSLRRRDAIFQFGAGDAPGHGVRAGGHSAITIHLHSR